MLARGEVFAGKLVRLDGRESRVEELGRAFGRLAEDDGVVHLERAKKLLGKQKGRKLTTRDRLMLKNH